MPVSSLTNVGGAGGETPFYSGPQIQDAQNTSATAIPYGALVAITTPIVGASPPQFGIALATVVATTYPLNIGIVVGGPYPGSAIPAGGFGQICVQGFCRALLDSSVSPTVPGHRLIQSALVAGALADSGGTAAAAGLNFGAVLEAVTIASGSALVNIYFAK